MMVTWQRTESVQFGVVISNFPGNNGYHLPLKFGDSVLIYEQTDNSEWYRGCPLINRTIKGIFPASHIEIKWRVDCISTSDADIGNSKELSVVLEITSVLKEWGAIWKQLFVKNNSEAVEHLKPLLNDLMNQRRRIMSGALTADQLKPFRIEIAHTIDYGNKYLGLDLVVRDTEGNVMDVDSTGVIDLYKRHLEPAQQIEMFPGDLHRTRSSYQAMQHLTVHNLYVSVKNVVCKVGDDADVFITLFDGQECRFISEHYVVGWNRNGMPKDLDKLQNLTCIFTDLGAHDLQRDKLYIVCQVIRDGIDIPAAGTLPGYLGSMDTKKDDKKVLTQKLRRPFGVAVLHISDIVKGKREETLDKELFVPLQLLGSDDVESVIKKFIQKIPSQGTGQGIWLTLKMLHGDVNQVKEEHPLLINQFTAVARKQGFPDVIMPGDIRNDLYLTLVSGNFEKGSKTSNKNIQVIVGVYDSSGNLLQNVVSAGAGEPMVSEHISTVYYHNANPKWHEVVKLSIPIEKVKNGSTIRFAFKHRATMDEKDKSQKVFSVSYVNLVAADGTCIQDGEHELAVYKCEAKKSEDNLLLKLPSFKQEIASGKKSLSSGNFHYSKTESFIIRTKLCSTKLAQNVDLLGLLKWKLQKEKLPTILPALVKVSGEEIVKFLQDTFDALFAILTYDAQQYGESVFDALVFCIGLTADKKYHQFRPILDAYIEKLFSSTKAYITMVNVLQKNLEDCENVNCGGDAYEHLKRYFKAIEYVVKFIVRSRTLSETATPGVGAEEFRLSIHKFFQSIINIMKLPQNNNLVVIQGYALKYIPAIYGDLLNVFDPVQLGCFATDIIESIPPDTLLTQKLTSMNQIVKSDLFANPRSRAVLLPMLVRQLKMYMGKFAELQICADILNEMLSRFSNSFEMGDTDNDIEYIVVNLFRSNVETVIRMDFKNQIVTKNPNTSQKILRSTGSLKGNYVTFIISILDLMKEHHYIAYINSYKDDYALLDGLMELFIVFREFVKGNVYPSDWVSMTMIQNNVILGALQYFSDHALYDKFLVGDNFQFQLWDNFFQLAVAFITQDSLQLENFSESKRNNILEKYSDMRITMGKRIIDMWHRLGRNKMRLMTNIVRPFLEMTLIPQTDLRKVTIPVFYDMIDCEFRIRQHFKQVESEVIMHLDQLIETGMKGDEEYKDLFSEILGDLFRQVQKSNSRLCEVGLIFVDTITRLLSRLLDYRSVISSEDNINNRMSCNVNILNFYQEIKREEMKERYIYKLCDLHLSVKSYTEAAFTLLQHAELLKWVNEPLNSTSSSMTSNRYNVKTQRELKEKLYLDAIDYFDKGNMWEYGISRCKELAQHYELEVYDYVKLSSILKQQAEFFEHIIKTVVRPEPTYFRVGYYGRGFPTFLRNKLFIQRGDEFEKLSDFTMRMRILFPLAQFLNSLEPPNEEITESRQQWIQICKVDPQPVERRRFRGKTVADQIKKFYEVNDVSEFALNRPFHRGTRDKENEFATLWIERITMNTEYSFPGKLRWFEVTSVNKVELSPIENAVDTMQSKNKELNTLLSQHTADPSLNYNNLSMVLNGTIDAAVMGGYANYEKIFFSKEYIESHPDETVFIDALKECIVEQVDVCEKCLLIHKRIISKELEPFQKKMEEQLKQNKIKAMPYRKVEDRRKTLFGGDKKVFSGNKTKKEFSSTQSMDRSAPPIPNRERNTIMGNLTQTGKRDSGFRHTAIIGMSPQGEFPYSMGELDAPPLPEKDRMMTMTLGRPPKHKPQSKLASNSYNDVSSSNNTPATPPSVPRKLKTQSVASVTRPDPVPVYPVPPVMDDSGDDDPPPPPPPKKSMKNRESIERPMEINNSSPRSSGISDEFLPQHESYIDQIDAVIPPSDMMENIPRSSTIMTERAPSVREKSRISDQIPDKYTLNDRIQISDNDHISPVLYRKKKSNRPSELLDNDGTPPSGTSPLMQRRVSPAPEHDDSSSTPPPCLPRVKGSYSEESSPSNISPALPKKPVVSPPVVVDSSPNLSPSVLRKKLDDLSVSGSSPNESPLSPRQTHIGIPSHEDLSHVDGSPIIPKKMPAHSQIDAQHPEGSPVIPKKKPVVPPPFGSTMATNQVSENNVETGDGHQIDESDQMNQNVESDDGDAPPPPVPPRQKAL